MAEKPLKAIEYPKMQVSKDKKSYRLLISVAYIRELEAQLGREIQQGEPWKMSLLEDMPGITATPLER